MPSLDVLITFTGLALVMNLSPGPSNLYVMARSIAQGTKAGFVAALGLAVGSLLHVFASAFGLAAIFAYSPTTYTVVKLVGAAYLIYLGISYWQSKPSGAQNIPNSGQKPFLSIFYESVVVEVTNPKTALFFLALLPQFVNPEAGPIAYQMVVLGLIVTVSALPCDALVAIASGRVSRWLLNHSLAQRVQQQVSGSILMGMGAYIVGHEITK